MNTFNINSLQLKNERMRMALETELGYWNFEALRCANMSRHAFEVIEIEKRRDKIRAALEYTQ